MPKSKVFRDLIIEWNSKFPVDRAWRKKYNIPFGSSQHMEMSLIDMKFDLMEDRLIQQLIEERLTEKENEAMGLKNIKTREIKMSQKEIEKEFDNLDLIQFNE